MIFSLSLAASSHLNQSISKSIDDRGLLRVDLVAEVVGRTVGARRVNLAVVYTLAFPEAIRSDLQLKGYGRSLRQRTRNNAISRFATGQGR